MLVFILLEEAIATGLGSGSIDVLISCRAEETEAPYKRNKTKGDLVTNKGCLINTAINLSMIKGNRRSVYH